MFHLESKALKTDAFQPSFSVPSAVEHRHYGRAVLPQPPRRASTEHDSSSSFHIVGKCWGGVYEVGSNYLPTQPDRFI